MYTPLPCAHRRDVPDRKTPLAPAFHLVQPTLGQVLDVWITLASKMSGQMAIEALLDKDPALRLCLPNNNHPNQHDYHHPALGPPGFQDFWLRSAGLNKEARINLLSRPATPEMMTKKLLTQAYDDTFAHFSGQEEPGAQ
jgi:hypothetical protein